MPELTARVPVKLVVPVRVIAPEALAIIMLL